MHHYLYRTTTDKLPADLTHIEASGDTVLERTKVDDRKWVLLCRKGERTVVDLTVRELVDAIRDGVVAGLRVARTRPDRLGVGPLSTLTRAQIAQRETGGGR